MESSAEQLLVQELSNGSVIAFNELYKEYCDLLFCFSFSLLKVKADAEEVVQLVFLKVWEKKSTLNPEISFKGYIYKITKNYVLKLINASLKERELNAEPFNALYSPMDNRGADIIFLELKRKLRREICNLPCQRKKVFIMSRNMHLSNNEIADSLQISANTVKRHMNLALKNLEGALC